MMASCPGCNTHYSLDERKVPPKGALLTCRECGKRWKVAAPQPEAATAAAGPFQPPQDVASRAVGRPAGHGDAESSGTRRNPVDCPKCGHTFVPAPPSAAEALSGTRAAGTSPAGRILLVEDQNYFAELTREALGEQYETVVASNLRDARRILSRDDFDIVILDLSLERDQDGVQVLQATRERGIPVLIFTARDETEIYGETWESLKSAGATDILIKGMNVGDDLRQKVQALLEHRRD